MNKYFYRLVATFGILGLSLFGFAVSAQAANDGIQISPVTFTYNINPGGTQTGSITIVNHNSETMDYAMEVGDFTSSTEDGAPIFSAVGPTSGVSSFVDWVAFPDGSTGSIPVGQSKVVNFVITLPANVEPGGHYGAIFAKQIKPLVNGGNEVGIAERVGALTLISVPGTTTQGAKILSFSVPKFVWSGQADLVTRVQNTGTIHYDSKAVVTIKNLIGPKIDVNLGTHTILPGSIRAYTATWGKYLFGYYQLTPTATDGSGATVTLPAVMVLAIPLIIVIPVIVGLILLLLLISYLRKHLKFISGTSTHKHNSYKPIHHKKD